MKKRDIFYDNTKILLIYLVLLGHFMDTAEAAPFAPFVRFFIYLFHMPALIFISGLFFKVDDIKENILRGMRFFVLFLFMKCLGWFTKYILFKATSFSLFNNSGMPWFLFAMAVWCILTPVALKAVSKSVLLIGTVFVALIVGFDPLVNSNYVLSRIIVFWPYFIAGVIIDRESLKTHLKRKISMVAGSVIILAVAIVIYYRYANVSVITPMLTAQHPYSTLNDLERFGPLFRTITYFISVLLGLSIMSLVPKNRLPFSYIGERILSVYFFGEALYSITVFAWTGLPMWEYFVLAAFFTALFSCSLFYQPIKRIISAPNPDTGMLTRIKEMRRKNKDNKTTAHASTTVNKGKSSTTNILNKEKKVIPADAKPISNTDYPNSQKEQVIQLKNVSMDFTREKDEATSIKETLIRTLKGEKEKYHFRALDDISFSISKGEVVGIIGTNGSGKSTTLKIISGALKPTAGTVLVDRSKVQLLTLGTGFDTELTGKENIYLNGAIIGYTKEFIDEHYDSIVEFAELEGFMDEKVRNYSSGMVQRLGFAIATARDSAQILILDEVFAVGDQFFRKKSEKRIKELIHSGSTAIIVSHSMDIIRKNCDRVIWIEKGHIRMIGEPDEVCDAYVNMSR